MNSPITITTELRARLDAATPEPGDVVAYCPCGWVGETNALYTAHTIWLPSPELGGRVHQHPARTWAHTLEREES